MSAPCNHSFIYRYLKSSDIKENLCWSTIDSSVCFTPVEARDFINEATFNLRPGEADVSFFRSFKSEEVHRILDVLNELRHRRNGGGFSAKSGMMKLDFEVAHEDLNDEGQVLLFKENDKTDRECRHYGLYILTQTSIQRLEVINALIEISRFFALKKKSKTPEKRDVLELQEAGSFFVLAHDVVME